MSPGGKGIGKRIAFFCQRSKLNQCILFNSKLYFMGDRWANSCLTNLAMPGCRGMPQRVPGRCDDWQRERHGRLACAPTCWWPWHGAGDHGDAAQGRQRQRVGASFRVIASVGSAQFVGAVLPVVDDVATVGWCWHHPQAASWLGPGGRLDDCGGPEVHHRCGRGDWLGRSAHRHRHPQRGVGVLCAGAGACHLPTPMHSKPASQPASQPRIPLSASHCPPTGTTP